jgi:hypothetical protein
MTPVTTTGTFPQAAAPAAPRAARREARLRPEHAERYPDIRAGQWEPAATLADRVLARALLRGRDMSLWVRLLRDDHFEFRGGGDLLSMADRRPRREDR